MIAAIVLAVLLVAAAWAAWVLLSIALWIPILVTVLAVGAVVGLVLWRRHKARVAAGEIERTLKSQADAHAETIRPDQQAEIDAMAAEFQKAVAALKGSKLARGGRDALALLPFYMIIGPPGAGKSTALRNSGLQFPYLSARGGGVKGVGGTRNCEWWLTNEAVLIDTAGRYTTEEEDREEWGAFLDMLGRTRPRKPINGLIVAVSVGDLGGETEEGVIDLAKRIRERMDEVMSRLQMVLPAYLLFTKCDLVPGFVEIFGDLRKQERGQIWGFTARVGESAVEGGPGELFRKRFDDLLEAVDARSLGRLPEERQIATRERIWRFPQQLEALRPNLATFVEHLFAENVYQDTPILRGVYFTSGTQEGRTIDRVMGAMAQAFGVRPGFEDAPVLEAKSYFLRDVFKKVMFPDQELAVRSAKAVKKQDLQRYVVGGVALALALLVFGFPLRAWFLNRSLVQSTAAIVANVAGILGKAQDTPRLDALDPLRERLDLLIKYEAEGAPLSMRFGMYQGGALLPGVRKLYAAAARRLVVEPVFAIELEEMDAFLRRYESSIALPSQGDYALQYDRLKLHLLLSGPRAPGEPAKPTDLAQAWIVDRLVERWIGGPKAKDPAAGQKVAGNAGLFVKLLADDPAIALTRYDDLVRRMRVVLSRVPTVSLAVEKLVREVEPRGLDLNLNGIMGEPVAVLRSTAAVRGAFTRKGYEEVVKARLDDPASVLEPWVLARDQKDQEERLAEASRQLRSRYFERYVDEWRRFLDATNVDLAAAGGALQLLRELTRGEPPPYARLLRAVAYNSRIGGMAAAVEKVGEGLLDRMKKGLGGGGGGGGQTVAGAAQKALAQGDREMGPRDVERAFAGLAAFGVPQDPNPAMALPGAGGGAPPAARSAPIDVYLEQLSFVRDALQQTVDGGPAAPLVERVGSARTRIRSLIDTAELGWRPRLEALLWPPLEAASGDAVKKGAQGASSEWCAAVFQPFRRALASRYPFNPNGEDAALADVAEFFKPTGVVWGFYEQALKADVQRAGEGFKFARQLGGQSGFRGELLTFLSRAQDVTRALFPAGAADPRVELSVKINPTPGVAVVVLEVDGQRFEYRNGPEEWYRVVWPGMGKRNGASLRVRAANGREEVVQQDGEWGLLRLVEAGKLRGDPGIRDFAVGWQLPSLGSTVTLVFRPARTESPFFGANRGGRARLYAPFRAGVMPPAVIGRTGAACN